MKSKDIYLLLRSDRPFKAILYFRQDLMQIKTVLFLSPKWHNNSIIWRVRVSAAMVNVEEIWKGATVNGLVNISITTLETRFGFESWMTGLMAVSYDIGFILVSLYVTFSLGQESILKRLCSLSNWCFDGVPLIGRS